MFCLCNEKRKLCDYIYRFISLQQLFWISSIIFWIFDNPLPHRGTFLLLSESIFDQYFFLTLDPRLILKHHESVWIPYVCHYKLQLVYFLPHCGLYSKVASVTDNFCTKQGNYSKNLRFVIKIRFQWCVYSNYFFMRNLSIIC